jgi:hypothetical protein
MGTKNTFRVTFRGEVIEGWNPNEVKANMAGLFKLDPSNQQHVQKINRMFSGRIVIIKDGINKSTAQAYIDAIARAGGKAHIKIKIGPPDGIEERRSSMRRMQVDRRTTARLSSIVPDRRKSRGRRETDPNE